ncbi:MAG: radical SAM protein [Patescibacteria group bacterium]|nr:radical SAM protein [Patescibacteria group bacterium]
MMGEYIFGPVPSRRLGRSLGVDLVPFKTCPYDCVYCQLGRTPCTTTERKEWVPLEGVLASLAPKLATKPDYITLSGSGEPTLYSRLDELIARIKAITDVPVAVLTNGALFGDKELRRQLMEADLVVPSLDAGDEAMFRAINRPHRSISFEAMLGGLIDFRAEFSGAYWLEVLVVGGYTSSPGELAKVAECARRIHPDRVQLNTVTRPPAEECVVGVSSRCLAELAMRFAPSAEVIADFRGAHGDAEFAAGRQEILEMLRRRPCSLEDIAVGLGMHRNEVIKHLEELRAGHLLDESVVAGKVYYHAKRVQGPLQ